MKRFSMAMTWLALAGLMTMVSCRKPVVGFTNGESRTVTISAVTESGSGSKTAIDGLNVKWSEKDQIKMNAESVLILEDECIGSTMGRFTGEVKGNGPYRIGYPAGKTTYDGETLKLNIPASWAYDADMKEIVPMAAYAEKVGDDVQFRNAVNMLKLQLKGVGDDDNANKLKRIVLTSASSNLSGDIRVTFEGTTPTFNAITDGEDVGNTMTVSFGDGLQLGNTVQCVYIPLAKIAADEVLTVRFICAVGEMKGKVTATADFDAVNNMLDSGEVEVKAVPVFSVDASGTTVEFAPGNLQYLGKSDGTGTWRFAEHQWDYMGDGLNTTTGYKGNVDLSSLGYSTYNTGSGSEAARDLFGWGCTGYQDERKESHTNWYQTNYQPYSTSTSSVSGGSGINYYGYGPDYYDASKYGLSVENKSDWGCLAIGSDPEGTWRTLSKDEWAYLLNTSGASSGARTDANRFAKAMVNGVVGLLIFPDGYTGTASGDGIAAVNNKSASYPSNSIPTGTWASMESAGVVFLPAAGNRNGASLYAVGSLGDYWSSSCYSSSYAYLMDFHSGNVNPQNISDRCLGFSVRLVR